MVNPLLNRIEPTTVTRKGFNMRSIHWSAALLVATIFFACAETASATIRNVPADYRTIQAGIDASRAGDTVLVRPGVYRTNLSIANRNIVIASLLLTTGDRSYIDSTVIDGNRSGSGVLFAGDGDTSSLRGFTIRNGQAPSGGGVSCRNNCNVSLEDLLITGNEAEATGGGVSALTARIRMKNVVVTRNQSNSGGGVHGGFDAVISMKGGTIDHNEAEMAGAVYLWRAQIRLYRVAVVENSASTQYGGIYSFDAPGEDGVLLENVTIANNVNDADCAAGGLMILAPREDFSCRIVNSILWGNSNAEIAMVDYNQANRVIVSYSDVEEGRDGIIPADDQIILVGDGLMNEQPMFADEEDGDYRLGVNSPCIDVGDPESEEDPDGTRADLGAYPANQRRFYLGGIVLNAVTEQPIAGADVRGTMRFGFGLRDSSDNDGRWGRWFFMLADTMTLRMTISARGYLPSRFDLDVNRNDSLSIETRLSFSAIEISDDDIPVVVDSGSTRSVPLTIVNNGNGALHWAADARSAGDAGSEPWTLRANIAVGDSANDDRVEGVAWDGENFYASGANGSDSSMIYVLNQDSELIRQFEQPTHSRYGMKDLEWDGEILWGSGDTMIYGMDREGDLINSWRTDLNPANNVAYDPEREILWLSGTTTNILGYDRNGNVLDTLNRKSLRIYGLAYYPDDPDGYNLYLLNNPGNGLSSGVYKMNTETGDTIRITDLTLPDGSTGISGAFICDNYDRYQGSVFMFVPNVPDANGGDRIHVLQLQPNEEWIRVAPGSGDIAAGDSAQVEIIICTVADDESWVFCPGEYEGVVTIEHDGQGERIVVPVHVTVQSPGGVDEVEAPLPSNFGFTSLYPQPFNSTLTIAYRLDAPGVVSLTLTDLMGREMFGRTGVPPVFRQFQPAGEHRVSFDATGLPSGVYFARLEAGGRRIGAKMVCLK